jgi:hypothetical protein
MYELDKLCLRDLLVFLLRKSQRLVLKYFVIIQPLHHTSHEGKVYLAHTLEETAKIAVDLANDVAVKKNYFEALAKPAVPTLPEDKVVKGLYSGGTCVYISSPKSMTS